MNIYVGNIPREATEDDLKSAFAAFGQVSKVMIIKDRGTNEPRGFGFVEMPSKTEAMAAMAGLNDQELMGRKLTVNEAKPREGGRGGGGGDRDRRGGGGGGGGRRFR